MRHGPRSLSRRLLLTGGAGVAAGVGLASCVGGDPEHSGAGGDGPPFPRTISHQFGGTRISRRPERIVTLGQGDGDVLAALGIMPTAILNWVDSWSLGVGPWAQPKLGGATPKRLTGPEIDFDAVARIAPDLMTFTRSDNARATWQRLDKLAPTLSGPASAEPYGTSWKDQATLIAAAVDRMVDGVRLVADTEAAVTAAKSANPGFAGKTVCVATAGAGQYQAYIRRDDRVQLIEALGFVNSPKIERTEPDTYVPGRYFTAMTSEYAEWLDADLTVVFDIGNGADSRNDPGLNNVSSAKAGRLLIIDDVDLATAFSTQTVLSIPYAVERFVALAMKALGL